MNENTHLVLLVNELIAIAGFIIIIFIPFKSGRVRARWAKALFIASGLIGVICYSFNFAINMHMIILDPKNDYKFHCFLYLIDGWLGGWLTALLFSGQIYGRKSPEAELAGR